MIMGCYPAQFVCGRENGLLATGRYTQLQTAYANLRKVTRAY